MPEKAYLTYVEAMELLGIGRSTLHTMMTELQIPHYKFRYDRKRYLARADVERLKQIREAPWTAEEKTQEERVT